MSSYTKKAIVIHSGGMDSSLCLALAIREFGADQILSLSFDYGQRHSRELVQAAKICADWSVDHTVLSVHCLSQITRNSLTDHTLSIEHPPGSPPNSLVEGRNGLMARLGAIHVKSLQGHVVYMGVMEIEEANSGYRDCNRHIMDLWQEELRLDLALPKLELRTPLIKMTKLQTLELADDLGLLSYLRDNTISCYRGEPMRGCENCPACLLRNGAFDAFYRKIF